MNRRVQQTIIFLGAALIGAFGAVQGLASITNVFDVRRGAISPSMSAIIVVFTAVVVGIAAVVGANAVEKVVEAEKTNERGPIRNRFWIVIVAVTIPLAQVTLVYITIAIILGGVLSYIVARTPTQTSYMPSPVIENSDWRPMPKTFNNVEMVLVPPGCFDMGENGEGGRQCFDNPFWIDRTEVTNIQFDSFDGQASQPVFQPDTNRPRQNITWYEAKVFCDKRQTRLPTEREWEYAARGPDNLMYPWGNTFVANNLVYGQNIPSETSNVGSKPNGVSWVGALDMTGNVPEWTASFFQNYPYDANDGRENTAGGGASRVIRGRSYAILDVDVLRSTFRSMSTSAIYSVAGFRCARDYQPGDI